jgi:hypothetical protein
MNSAEPNSSLGFLTVLELTAVGYCGGLLLLNERGRPLEFHCNAPIQPTRTQQVLYGASLRPLLLTEAIAKSLIEKCTAAPIVLLTNLAELWELDAHIAMPLALVVDQFYGGFSSDSTGDVTADLPSAWFPFELGGQAIAARSEQPERRAQLESLLRDFAQRLPLAEPFQRIKNAIEEAHSSARLRESA